MKRRRVLGLLGGASLLGSTALGSGAFSSVEAERETRIQVAEDENAYLGLTYESEAKVGCGGTISDAITIRNNTTEDLSDIEIALELNSGTIDSVEVSDSGDESDSSEIEVDSNKTTLTINQFSDILPEDDDEPQFKTGEEIVLTISVDGFGGNSTSTLSFDVTAGGETDGTSIETDSSREISIEYSCLQDLDDCDDLSAASGEPAIEKDGEIEIEGKEKTIYDGDIVANGGGSICITSEDTNVVILGNIVANGGEIEIEEDVGIVGDVTSNGNGIIDVSNAVICGKVTANGGDIKIEESDIGGNVTSNSGNLNINSSGIKGNVETRGSGECEIESSEIGGRKGNCKNNDDGESD